MNKRLITFLPILSLFLSLPLIPVKAAVNAGGTCSKAGITSVVSGKTYTCIKSGKKLVWDKGVAVVKPTQITPVNAEIKDAGICSERGITAVDSAGKSYICRAFETFEVLANGDHVNFVVHLEWELKDIHLGRCDPSGWMGYDTLGNTKTAVPTPVRKKAEPLPSIAPIKSADYPLVGARAKNTILNQKASVHNPFVIYWDPTTTELNRKFYSEQIEIMKKYLSPMIPNNSKVHLYILGSDKEWACNEVFKKASDGLIISTNYLVSSQCYGPNGGSGIFIDAPTDPDYKKYPGAGGGLSVLGNGFGMVALSNCNRKIGGEDILFHEAFHAIQWIYTSHKLDSKEAVKFPTLKQKSPTWMREGSAQYMGFLLSAEGVRAGPASANNIWTSAAGDKRGFILANSGSWKNGYETFAADETDGYSIGAVMFEYLLAKYGLERTLSVWPETINILNPSEISNDAAGRAASKVAFKTVFGLSFEDFLNEVKPYIEWSLEKADLVCRVADCSNFDNSSGGATPTPIPTQKPTTSTDIGNPAFQELGAKCNPSKETSGKTKDGTQLMCIAVSAGVGSWQKK